MRKSIFTLLLAMCVCALNASADKNTSVDKKVVNINSKYSAIHASTGAKVVYTPWSSSNSVVEISGPAENINWIEVFVQGNALCVRTKPDSHGNHNGKRIRGVTVYLNGPLVSNFQASSSGEIKTNAWLQFKKSTLSLSASSSGEIKLSKVSAPSIIARASSSGEIEIESVNSTSINLSANSSGEIEIDTLSGKSLKVSSSSAGDIDIDTAIADSVSAAASSSGDIKISSVKTANLSAASSSSGDIEVGGTANRAVLSASSGGDINVSNLSCSNTSVRSSTGGSIKGH